MPPIEINGVGTTGPLAFRLALIEIHFDFLALKTMSHPSAYSSHMFTFYLGGGESIVEPFVYAGKWLRHVVTT